MYQILHLFWGICLFRSGPQDVPASVMLFWVTLILGLVIACLNLFLLSSEFALGQIIVYVLINSAVLLGGVLLLLVLFGYSARSIQTLTALTGTGLIYNLGLLPLLSLMALFPVEASMLGLIVFVIEFWHLAIIAYILRHALSIHLFHAGLLVLGFVLLAFEITDLILPQGG